MNLDHHAFHPGHANILESIIELYIGARVDVDASFSLDYRTKHDQGDVIPDALPYSFRLVFQVTYPSIAGYSVPTSQEQTKQSLSVLCTLYLQIYSQGKRQCPQENLLITSPHHHKQLKYIGSCTLNSPLLFKESCTSFGRRAQSSYPIYSSANGCIIQQCQFCPIPASSLSQGS